MARLYCEILFTNNIMNNDRVKFLTGCSYEGYRRKPMERSDGKSLIGLLYLERISMLIAN
jgi:hypothetical protein